MTPQQWALHTKRRLHGHISHSDRQSSRLNGGSPNRGQSAVIGVTILLAITLVGLGLMTATIGGIVNQQASAADARRVSADMTNALRPVEMTGMHQNTVSFTGGQLTTVERTVRVLDGRTTVAEVDTGGLQYRHRGHRVTFVAGAVVRGDGERATFRRGPPITIDDSVLIIGAAVLNVSDITIGAQGATSVSLRTNVSHNRRTLGTGDWRLAVETAIPGPWRDYFTTRGAETTLRDFDGDGVPSVVANFHGQRQAYLVVHAMELEVSGGD